MCWKCVELDGATEGEAVNASLATDAPDQTTRARNSRQPGWLTADRYADWPAWGTEPEDDASAPAS